MIPHLKKGNSTFRIKRTQLGYISNFHTIISKESLKILLKPNAVQKIKFEALSLYPLFSLLGACHNFHVTL